MERRYVMQLRELFFKNFVFGFVDEESDIILRSQYRLALGILPEMCDKSEKLNNMSISEILDFLNVQGDLENLNTYNKIIDACVEAKDLSDVYDLSKTTESLRLKYCRAMVLAVQKYVSNRNKELEQAFDYFISQDITEGTLGSIIDLITKNNNGDYNKYREACKVADHYIVIARKLKELSQNPEFSSLEQNNKNYKLYVAFQDEK